MKSAAYGIQGNKSHCHNRKLSSIKYRGQTDHVTALPRLHALDIDLYLTYDLDYQYQASYGHGHTHKTQVQRSVGLIDRVKTNGRTDGQTDATDCFTFPANAAGNGSE